MEELEDCGAGGLMSSRASRAVPTVEVEELELWSTGVELDMVERDKRCATCESTSWLTGP